MDRQVLHTACVPGTAKPWTATAHPPRHGYGVQQGLQQLPAIDGAGTTLPVPCSAGWAQVQQAAADGNLAVTTCEVGGNESQVHFGSPAVRLNLVNYTVERWYCTGWNAGPSPIVSVSPLTAPQIEACRSIISNICTQSQQ